MQEFIEKNTNIVSIYESMHHMAKTCNSKDWENVFPQR